MDSEKFEFSFYTTVDEKKRSKAHLRPQAFSILTIPHPFKFNWDLLRLKCWTALKEANFSV